MRNVLFVLAGVVVMGLAPASADDAGKTDTATTDSSSKTADGDAAPAKPLTYAEKRALAKKLRREKAAGGSKSDDKK